MLDKWYGVLFCYRDGRFKISEVCEMNEQGSVLCHDSIGNGIPKSVGWFKITKTPELAAEYQHSGPFVYDDIGDFVAIDRDPSVAAIWRYAIMVGFGSHRAVTAKKNLDYQDVCRN